MACAQRVVNSIVWRRDFRHNYRMKHAITATLLVVLCGCAPPPVFYRAGATPAQMQSDLLRCEVSALEAVPIATVLRRDPPEYIPGAVVCDSSGTCVQQAGFYIPGAIFTEDANTALRAKVTQDCMERRGYGLIALRRCAGAAPVPLPADGVLPALSPQSCLIPQPGGKWQIGAPAP